MIMKFHSSLDINTKVLEVLTSSLGIHHWVLKTLKKWMGMLKMGWDYYPLSSIKFQQGFQSA